MERILSNLCLKNYLETLKNILQSFDERTLSNVIFFNPHSYYIFLASLTDSSLADKGESAQYDSDSSLAREKDSSSYDTSLSKNERKSPPNTVGAILDKIEPYIPFGLTNETLDIFLTAYQAKTPEEMENIRIQFSYRSRLDFLNLIKKTTDPCAWKELVNSCEKLRLEKKFELLQQNQ